VTISEAQGGTLRTLVDRLIPADELGAGALEAGVLEYLRAELEGELSEYAPIYESGLATLDAVSHETYGSAFASLTPARQDMLLVAASSPDGTLTAALGEFFQVVLNHTIDGFLCDPTRGGNRDSLGWKLIGYTGPNLAPSEEEQQIGHQAPVALMRTIRSWPMPASVPVDGGR
jgi:gluconate 2-dehydrogenase gamma chain